MSFYSTKLKIIHIPKLRSCNRKIFKGCDILFELICRSMLNNCFFIKISYK